MAKNKIEIDVQVDDKGTTKKVGLEAARASSNLDKIGKSSRTADRNVKGVAAASSNATKNFSKMAQGLGGVLVPAYATLAAQLFAVSAAFNFLKGAGDLRVLEAGQKAYASSTGIALKSITNDIIAATNAQINFKDASQAAAIGISSGLSPDQLTRLGKAAKDASSILGRDVTDSFNRLVRGVTKAEPELLDELGIILRLDDASKEYADTLGINAKELTTFQRSQAVANKVLTEAESKYGKILEITGGDQTANNFAQLGKAMNDVLLQIQKVVGALAGPLAKVLTDTPALAVASFGLLLKGPLSAVGISFDDMAAKAQRSAAVQERAYSMLKARAEKAKVSVESLTTALRNQSKQAIAGGAKSKILENFAGGGVMTPQALATLKRSLKAAELHVNEHSIITQGIFKGLHINVVKEYGTMMAQLELAEKSKVAGTQRNVSKLALAWSRGSAMIKSSIATVGSIATKALSWFGWIGIAVTAFELLRDQTGLFTKKLTEQEKVFENNAKKIKDLNEEYENFVAIQKELVTGQSSIAVTTGLQNLGEVISATSLPQLKQLTEQYREYTNATAENKKALEASIRVTKVAGIGVGTSFGGGLVATGIDTKKTVEITEAMSDANEQISIQRRGYELLQKELGASSTVFNKYFEALKTGSVEAVLKAREDIKAFVATIKELKQATKASQTSAQAFFDSFAPLNSAETALRNLNAELKLTEKIIADGATLSDAEDKRYKEVQRQLKTIALINDTLRKNERDVLSLKVKQLNTQRGMTPLQKADSDLRYNIRNIALEQEKIENQRLGIQRAINEEQSGVATPQQEHQLEILKLKTGELDIQRTLLQDQLNIVSQIEEAGRNAFESSTTNALSALIKGENSSFTQAVKDITLGTLNAVADTLAKNISKSISDFIFGNKDPEVKMENAIKRGADYFAMVASAAVKGEKVIPEGVSKSAAAGTKGDLPGFSLSKYLFGKGGKGTATGELDPAGSNVSASAVSGGGIFTPFISSIKELFSGDAPFLKGLGAVFSTGLDGFGSLFSDIFSGIFGGSGGSGIGGFIASLFATGGIATGGFRAFASGGTVNKPTVGLVGEGKYNEAIVPLPDGKSIPVQMGGNTGGTNNVTVNVNVSDSGSSMQQEGNSGQAGNLGKAIAAAVQQELQNQKRSGGILNPYGVA